MAGEYKWNQSHYVHQRELKDPSGRLIKFIVRKIFNWSGAKQKKNYVGIKGNRSL